MRTVQLLGGGWSWGATPQLREDAEQWPLNNVMIGRYAGTVERWSRWFDLHTASHIQARRPAAWDWYTQQDGRRPIYLRDETAAVPGSVAFPFDAVRAAFSSPTHEERDFWGSLSWMLAFAICEGFERIELLWFPLMEAAYGAQVVSARYWIGQARARGLDVVIHGDSMLKPQRPLYGCEAVAPLVEVA